MKKAVFILFISISLIANAQESSQTDVKAGVHFEFSAKIGAGLNMPAFNRKNGGDHLFLDVLQKEGNFNTIAFQAVLAGRKNFSLLFEAGYGSSYNYISYTYGDASPGSSKTDAGNYTMRIKKTELALMAKHYLTSHRIFYINYGLYLAAEDQKTITGTLRHSGSSYDPNLPTISHYYSYDSTIVYDNKHESVGDQVGLLQGIGWNIPFQNKSSVFIDLRLNAHRVYTPAKDIFFRIFDLGLSVGYTFYKTKGHSSIQNSTVTE